MSAQRKFSPVSIQHGDQRRRGFRIECCKCGESESIPVNTIRGGDEEQAMKITARKFVAHGWVLGHNAQNDICLKCAVAKRLVPAPNITPAKSQPNLTLVEKPPMTMNAPAAAPKPAELTADDAMSIISVLHEHYIDKEKGYDRGWSDKKVAEDLNVPVSWVKSCRVKFYGAGAGGNEDIDDAIKEAGALLEKANTFNAAAERVEKEAKRLLAEAVGLRQRSESIARRVHAIGQAVL